jgi:hypothetical protein
VNDEVNDELNVDAKDEAKEAAGEEDLTKERSIVIGTGGDIYRSRRILGLKMAAEVQLAQYREVWRLTDGIL